mgnify:CR=1 FL=1
MSSNQFTPKLRYTQKDSCNSSWTFIDGQNVSDIEVPQFIKNLFTSFDDSRYGKMGKDLIEGAGWSATCTPGASQGTDAACDGNLVCTNSAFPGETANPTVYHCHCPVGNFKPDGEGTSCTPCSPVDNAANDATYTCSSATDSRFNSGPNCDTGYTLTRGTVATGSTLGTADTCTSSGGATNANPTCAGTTCPTGWVTDPSAATTAVAGAAAVMTVDTNYANPGTDVATCCNEVTIADSSTEIAAANVQAAFSATATTMATVGELTCNTGFSGTVTPTVTSGAVLRVPGCSANPTCDNFDCSSETNDLIADPEDVTCTAATCTATECCTVLPEQNTCTAAFGESVSGSSHPCNLNAPGWDPTTEIDNIKGQPQWYSQKDPLPASISPVAKDAFTTAIGDNSDLGQTPHSVILDEYWSLCCKDADWDNYCGTTDWSSSSWGSWGVGFGCPLFSSQSS